MKLLPFLLIVFSIAMVGFACGSLAGKSFSDGKIEKVANNTLENMENLKRDCEKSLPRDKVCVMVFDYVPVENDYEQ